MPPRPSDPILAKLQDILCVEPYKCQDSTKDKWKEVGPLFLEDLVKQRKLNFDATFEVHKDVHHGYHGQIDTNGKWCGIGRYDWKDHYVYEGEYFDNNINGFGRSIHKNGDVYVGYWKNGTMHGQGCMKYTDGRI